MIAPSVANKPAMGGQSTRRRLWHYGPLLCWMAVIFFASTSEFSASNTALIIQPVLRWLFPHIGDERVAFVHFLVRKAAHFSEYAILGLLAARAFFTSTHDLLRRAWFPTGFLLVAIYALGDEFHQSFVPSRTPSVYDSFIDMAGGLTALIIFAFRHRRTALRARESALS